MKIRFSIRDLLWLTLVVAIGTGWLASHYQANKHLKAERAAMKVQAAKYAELLKEEYEKPRKPRFQPLAQG